MAKERIDSLYITSKEAGAGSMVLALGLLERLQHHYGNVALYRPLTPAGEEDSDLETLREYFRLRQPPEESRGVALEEAERILAEEGKDGLIERVLEPFEKLRERYDFVVCLGIRMEEINRLLGTDLNIELAKNLSAPVAGVFSMRGETEEDFAEIVRLWSRSIRQQGAEIFLLCGNHCEGDFCARFSPDGIGEDFPVCAFPVVEELERLTPGDLMRHLPLEWIAGEPSQRENSILGFRFGTMGLPTLLRDLKPGEFLITSSDRSDLVAGLLLSAQSLTTPPSGGILLCGGSPDPALLRLLEGLREIPIPLLYTKKYESELLPDAVAIKPSIRTETPRKIATALNLFAEYADSRKIDERLESMQQEIMTPMMFRLRLFERARTVPKKIILPETEDDRILVAADILLRRRVAGIVLVGSSGEIGRRARKLGIDLSDAGILDPGDVKLREYYAGLYYGLRKHKGVTLQMARDRMMDRMLLATMALYEGRVDGLVAGALHSTRDTISPALRVIRTREGYPLASSCFFMCLPTRVLVYADCAVNPDPTAEELAVIAQQTAETAERFGIAPRIAMLSYSTGRSGEGDDVDKVRRATEILMKRRPDLPVAGPIQYDAAIDPEVARIKMPDNPTAGHATVFIFPDLDTGNIAYKAVQRSSGAVAVGPVMQGLRRPVNDLSRGCSVDDIIDTVAITAIQAAGDGKENR